MGPLFTAKETDVDMLDIFGGKIAVWAPGSRGRLEEPERVVGSVGAPFSKLSTRVPVFPFAVVVPRDGDRCRWSARW